MNEAMACGLPVIVSKRAGSYRDLVKEGINGYGFDPYNKEELIKIMSKFINQEVDLKKMGEESRKNYKGVFSREYGKKYFIYYQI